MHKISLALVAFGFWLLLSGHYVPLLFALGALSVVLVIAIALRMDVLDHEGHPIYLSLRALMYWPWLTWEIVKSNLHVARRVLDPRMPISPSIIRVKANQKSELGKVIYANSITLTPGTVSIDVKRNEIEVHALTREAAESLIQSDMGRRVRNLEGNG